MSSLAITKDELAWNPVEGMARYARARQAVLQSKPKAKPTDTLPEPAPIESCPQVDIIPETPAIIEQVEQQERVILQLPTPDLPPPERRFDDFLSKRPAIRIIREVASEYGLSVLDIRGKRRDAYTIEARFKCCWRMKTETEMSYPEMGRALGGRDHTTILHAVRQYQNLMTTGQHNRQLRAYQCPSTATYACMR